MDCGNIGGRQILGNYGWKWVLVGLILLMAHSVIARAKTDTGSCEALIADSFLSNDPRIADETLRELERLLNRNSFVVSRDLSDYDNELEFNFLDELSGSHPGIIWLDAGAGRALAQRQFMRMPQAKGAKLFALAFKRPWWTPKSIQGEHQTEFSYLDPIDLDEVIDDVIPFQNSFDLITDVFGPLSYGKDPSKILNLYLKWLKPGGTLRIAMRGFGTSVTSSDQSKRSLTEWLKIQLSKLNGVEFKEHHSSWVIRKLGSPVKIERSLKLTHMYLSKPPSRHFIDF